MSMYCLGASPRSLPCCTDRMDKGVTKQQANTAMAKIAALGAQYRKSKSMGNTALSQDILKEMVATKLAAADAVEAELYHRVHRLCHGDRHQHGTASKIPSLLSSQNPDLLPLLHALPTLRKRAFEKDIRRRRKLALKQSRDELEGVPAHTPTKRLLRQRSVCSACDRPSKTCLCPFLPRPRVANRRIHVIVLMHPKELERKITTVKLAALSLENCDVLVGRQLDAFLANGRCPALDEALNKNLAGEGVTCVLFPGEGAFDLSTAANQSQVNNNLAVREPPLPSARFLLVFDGTWRFAREMFVKNRHHLQGTTQVQFSRPFGMGLLGLSEFVTRVEPADMCASTLEAIVAALCALDPSLEPRRADMLRPLRQMMRFQLGKGRLAHGTAREEQGRDQVIDPTAAEWNEMDTPVMEMRPGAHIRSKVPHRQRPWATLNSKPRESVK